MPKAEGCITDTSLKVCSNYFTPYYHGNHVLLGVLGLQNMVSLVMVHK